MTAPKLLVGPLSRIAGMSSATWVHLPAPGKSQGFSRPEGRLAMESLVFAVRAWRLSRSCGGTTGLGGAGSAGLSRSCGGTVSGGRRDRECRGLRTVRFLGYPCHCGSSAACARVLRETFVWYPRRRRSGSLLRQSLPQSKHGVVPRPDTRGVPVGLPSLLLVALVRLNSCYGSQIREHPRSRPARSWSSVVVLGVIPRPSTVDQNR